MKYYITIYEKLKIILFAIYYFVDVANESVTKIRRRIKIKIEINKIEIKITKIVENIVELILVTNILARILIYLVFYI